MSKSVPYINEIVSLTILLLMALALIAGQADARIHTAAGAKDAMPELKAVEEASAPFRTTIKARINGRPLTISIDAVAELSYFRFEDE